MIFILENNELIVVRTNSDDSGSYKCEAYNAYSSDEKTVNITIEGILYKTCFAGSKLAILKIFGLLPKADK